MMRTLELLAPAGNADIAIEAIKHGADAVYIGASSHGARHNAANSLDDIRQVVDFAHIFRVRVYVTVNTIVYDKELLQVERLISDLYRIGVDAIIVQDMGILRMDIPPIELHASTQCDIRTPGKAKFLQDVGFSQLVLPRELTLQEIKAISETVSVPVECFVHGALCVSYSGRCHASAATCGRSANRGECAQLCRLPYTLTDAEGKILSKDKHLLSLKDLNTSHLLPDMIEAGASSFKIEGRLKEVSYVKNVTAYYRRVLDRFIEKHPEEYRRSSFGTSEIRFSPQLDKSFNRGFSQYFIAGRRPKSLTSPLTPKSMGETVADIRQLHNGDGISYFDRNGEYTGTLVNGVENGRIITSGRINIPAGTEIHRTFDRVWDSQLKKDTADRKIGVEMHLSESGLRLTDERGCSVKVPYRGVTDIARKPMDFRGIFEKLGNTPYRLTGYSSSLDEMTFIPAAQLTALRREGIEALDLANLTTYKYGYRRPESRESRYMKESLDFRDNVANRLARQFYTEHGVKMIEGSIESKDKKIGKGLRVMTTRHCILRELGMCKKEKGSRRVAEPLKIVSGLNGFLLEFNCRDCEMHLLLD